MSQNTKGKYIEKYHYYYLIGISVIIIIAIFSFNYGGGERAGNILGFSATLSSIVLALVAILMTIVDLAGQRNTVADLKESADKLGLNLITTNEGIKEISTLKEELMSSMESIIKSNLEMSKEIASLKEKYSIDENSDSDINNSKNADILEDLEGLNERLSRIYINNKNKKYEESQHHTIEDLKATAYIRTMLRRALKKDTDYEFDDIYTIFKTKKTNVSRPRLKHELNKLVNSGNVERVDNRYYRIIRI